MRNRSIAREIVLKALYNLDVDGCPPAEAIDAALYLSEDGAFDKRQIIDFVKELLEGIAETRTELDKHIQLFSENWPMDRISIVDRNILRIGLYELLFRDDIPPKVTINEAVELAKRFSEGDSYRFVNGLLDRAKKELCPTK